MLLAPLGLALLTGVTPGGSYVGQVLPGAFLSALGMGFTLVTGTIAAIQGVERAERAGSGLLNTSRLVGGALRIWRSSAPSRRARAAGLPVRAP